MVWRWQNIEEYEKEELNISIPVTMKHRCFDDEYVVFFDLPMDNESLYSHIDMIDMMDMDPNECMVDRIGHPLLEKFEGKQVNIHALNFLAKRLYSFSREEMEKFDALMYMIEVETIEEVIDLSYNLDIVGISKEYDPEYVLQVSVDEKFVCMKEDFKVQGLSAVMDLICRGDKGGAFYRNRIAHTQSCFNKSNCLYTQIPFRKEHLEFLNRCYDLEETRIISMDDSQECARPFNSIQGEFDLKKLNELAEKITAKDFEVGKWRTYVYEYKLYDINQMIYLCDHMKELEYDDDILTVEEYGRSILSGWFKGSQNQFDEIAGRFDVEALGKEMCRAREMTCTGDGLLTSKEKVMRGVNDTFPDRETVKRLREQYPQGTRIRLNEMKDAMAVESEMMGTVTMVDDAGQIHMHWDDGRSLALIPGEDSFEVQSIPEQEQEAGMKML